LEKNLGLPEAAFDSFPRQELYFTHGPIPPEPAPAPHQGEMRLPPETHRYRLMAEQPYSTHKGGTEWRVGEAQFPISKTITGIVLDLEPGALRELHWHPNADEWQYVIDGQVDVTLFGSKGRYRIESLNAGDVGYIPQGYGHSIENTGASRARILIAFNAGQYEAIDLSQWIAATPDYLLADHFGQTETVNQRLPRRDEFVVPD
jgi:oxalate decarboxylase